LPDGKLLVVGGGIDGPAGLKATGTAEIVDPVTGTSRMTGSLADARYKHAVIALPSGKVIALGGSDERDSRGKLDTVESYDPATDRFTASGRLLARRYKIANSVVLLRDGRILVAGGGPRAEIHDPAAGRSLPVGPQLGGSLNFATATLLPRGGTLIAGGYYEDGIRMNRRAWQLK
jgi:hypothetical protein